MNYIANNYQDTLTREITRNLIAKIFYIERTSIQDSHVFSRVNNLDFSSLSDENLTKMTMQMSEASLAKDWDNEIDAIWDTI